MCCRVYDSNAGVLQCMTVMLVCCRVYDGTAGVLQCVTIMLVCCRADQDGTQWVRWPYRW